MTTCLPLKRLWDLFSLWQRARPHNKPHPKIFCWPKNVSVKLTSVEWRSF